MSNGEIYLFLYGLGFIVSLLHLTNVNLFGIETRILNSFLWPWVLLRFAFQFVGYVTFSAFFCVMDWLLYSGNVNITSELPALEYKELDEKR